MNVNYEAALQYIDIGNYEKAQESLEKAITIEEEKGDGLAAAQYRCVLGELFANLGNVENAREQFQRVIYYCDNTNTLGTQRKIAQTYIDAFDGKIPAPAKPTRNPSVPLVPKPVQDKSFISGKMRRK